MFRQSKKKKNTCGLQPRDQLKSSVTPSCCQMLAIMLEERELARAAWRSASDLRHSPSAFN